MTPYHLPIKYRYAYDGDGRLTAIHALGRDGADHTMAYDALGRLTAFDHTRYAYNCLGQRGARGHVFTRQFCSDRDARNRTVMSVQLFLKTCSFASTYDANDAMLARYYAQGESHRGQPYCYAKAQVGSVVALVDARGRVAGRLG